MSEQLQRKHNEWWKIINIKIPVWKKNIMIKSRQTRWFFKRGL